jgi:hypothetical protein
VSDKVTVPVITRYVVIELTGEEPWVNNWAGLLKGEVETTVEFMDAFHENAHGSRRDPKTMIVSVYDRRME